MPAFASPPSVIAFVCALLFSLLTRFSGRRLMRSSVLHHIERAVVVLVFVYGEFEWEPIARKLLASSANPLSVSLRFLVRCDDASLAVERSVVPTDLRTRVALRVRACTHEDGTWQKLCSEFVLGDESVVAVLHAAATPVPMWDASLREIVRRDAAGD